MTSTGSPEYRDTAPQSAEEVLEDELNRAASTHRKNLAHWVKSFASKELARPLGNLNRDFPPDNETDPIRTQSRLTLSNQVLDSCYRAFMFSQNPPPIYAELRAIQDAIKRIGPQVKAISKARNFLDLSESPPDDAHRTITGLAFSHARLMLKEKGVDIRNCIQDKPNNLVAIDKILRKYLLDIEASRPSPDLQSMLENLIERFFSEIETDISLQDPWELLNTICDGYSHSLNSLTPSPELAKALVDAIRSQLTQIDRTKNLANRTAILAKIINIYSTQLATAMPQPNVEHIFECILKAYLTPNTPPTNRREWADLPGDIFEAYSIGLESLNPHTSESARKAASSFGCLLYEKPLKPGKRPDVETMLLFDLVQTFALESLNVGSYDKLDMTMPEGNLDYPLAIDFVEATFAGRIKSGQPRSKKRLRGTLRSLLRENPDLKFTDWPIPNE